MGYQSWPPDYVSTDLESASVMAEEDVEPPDDDDVDPEDAARLAREGRGRRGRRPPRMWNWGQP